MDYNSLDYMTLCRLFPEGPVTLRDALKEIPGGAWDFRPNVEGAWTISEHVRHIADFEASFYIRAKLCIAQPGADIMALDEEAWARSVYPIGEDVEAYLKLFEQLRSLLTPFLLRVSPEQADEAWVKHPARGRLSLKNLLAIYVRHLFVHLEFLERNKAAFLSTI